MLLDVAVEHPFADIERDEADLDLDVWAGVVPLSMTAGIPEPAPDLASGIPIPAHVVNMAPPT